MSGIKEKLSGMKKSTRQELITYGIVALLFIVFQTLSSTGNLSRGLTGQLIPVCVYITAAVALNLVVGISGELSLGHAGFLSIGAFSGVVFCNLFSGIGNTTIELVLAMFCGGIVAGLFGFLIGIPVLRLRGDYLAIVTLAFGQIIKNLMNCIYLGYDANGAWHFSFGKAISGDVTSVLNGPMGIVGNHKTATFAVGFGLIMFTLFIVLNLIKSKTGRAIMAIRDNRIAAESIGLAAKHFKMIAFVMSAFITGMAGTLYGMNFASVSPAKFDFNQSILILIFVVLGGIGNIRGSILAAIVLTILPEQLRAVGDYRMLIYAVLLIVMMIVSQSAGGKRIISATLERIRGLLGKKSKTETEGGAGK
jgi:branched-chain amino acid transport system permease protein